MIEQTLNDVTDSIIAHEPEIVALVEGTKDAIGENRYGAFPETNSALPLDGVAVTPDNLTGTFTNETLSLADIGVTDEKFNTVNGIGFQHIAPEGKLGFRILYKLEATIENQADLDFLAKFNGAGSPSIGDVVGISKIVHYAPQVIYDGWIWYYNEPGILGGVL